MNIRRSQTVILMSALCWPALTFADQEVSERLTVAPEQPVRLHCTRGDIAVVGWDRAEVLVEGSIDDLAERLVLEDRDGVTLVRMRMPERGINRGDGADLVVRVPAHAPLQVDAVSADVKLENLLGPVAVRTVSGDVDGTGLTNRVRVSTTSGDVDLEDGSGQVMITTTSGDATVAMAATEVQIDTVSGEVELELEAFDSVVASMVSGDFELDGALNPDGRIETNSVNNDVELRLAEPVNATVDIRTGPGGEIDNRLSDEKPERRNNLGFALQTVFGDGSGLIRLETVNGEIALEGQ